MVSDALEDPSPPWPSLGLGKIKRKKSSMLPTELSGHLLKCVPNLKIIQSLPKFHWKRLLNPIFDQFPPNFANGDLCQVNSYEKNATFIMK